MRQGEWYRTGREYVNRRVRRVFLRKYPIWCRTNPRLSLVSPSPLSEDTMTAVMAQADTGQHDRRVSPETRVSLPLRAWLAVPDWGFRVVGAGFFLLYAATRMRVYSTDFPNVGPYLIVSAAGERMYFPTAKILTDLTFLLIALSFCIRVPPRERAMRPSEIVVPLIAGFWPLLPFFALSLLGPIAPEWAKALKASFGFGPIRRIQFYFGVLLLVVGNGFDVWGYGTLCRSLSIVAEARILKTRGPYRLVRHPIYLGQFIAQAGFWLVLVRLQLVWIVFYVVFVAMQLYRSRVEDRVLERAFGESYVRWKRRTFWFV